MGQLTKLDIMKAANEAHWGDLEGHYDPETGDYRPDPAGMLERLIAAKIDEVFDDEGPDGVDTIASDFRAMAEELMRLAEVMDYLYPCDEDEDEDEDEEAA